MWIRGPTHAIFSIGRRPHGHASYQLTESAGELCHEVLFVSIITNKPCWPLKAQPLNRDIPRHDVATDIVRC